MAARARIAALICAALGCAVAATPVIARSADDAVPFDISSGHLGEALNRLATQADIDIVLDARVDGSLRVRGVRGRMSVAAALRRLLDGTGSRAERIADSGWRVMAAPKRRAVPVRIGPVAQAGADIVVTGSKRREPLRTYAGTIGVIDVGALGPANAPSGLDALVARSATLDTTHFGPGREKIFIRGVSDSSLLGALQSTIGQYFGEYRLAYAAPAADLALIDIERIEVLEGPQGTLYGSGALGGVIRITPRAADPGHYAASGGGGASLTQHGGPSVDATAMLNIPLAEGRLALRIIGHVRHDGGYIDDATRHRSDTNISRLRGARGTLRGIFGAWTVDLTLAEQGIASADNHAATPGAPRWTRRGIAAQPYDSDFALVGGTASRRIGNAELVTTANWSRQALDERYTAQVAANALPSFFQRRFHGETLFHETRLAQDRFDDAIGWVAGMAFARFDAVSGTRALTRQDRAAPDRIVANRVREGALFGQLRIAPTSRLRLTAGVRLAQATLSGRITTLPLPDLSAAADDSPPPRRRRTSRRLLPSVGVHWQLFEPAGIFARFEESYRPGGITDDPGGLGEFRLDRLSFMETGLRLSLGDARGLAVSVSQTRWRDVQADAVGPDGSPITLNLGDATIAAATASFDMRVNSALAIQASLFVNRNRLAGRDPGIGLDSVSRLANVAPFGASLNADYGLGVVGGWNARVSSALRYHGRSRLGTGVGLNITQGGYCDTQFGVRLSKRGAAVAFELSNLFNSAANRFALASPYRLYEPEATPPRPRTLRIGLEQRF